MPEIRELILEGKGKRVYATDDPDKAVIYFKDEAMAFHGLKRGRILGKGEVNNSVCEHLFTLLGENGIENHFIEKLDARQSLVRRCEMMPFAVKVRNRVAGSLHTRIGLPVGMKLNPPVIEFVLRDTELDNDPLVNHTHLLALKAATMDEINTVRQLSKKINEVLATYMSEINIELIDFKIQFGRFHGKILLADEITPDTARFWDSKTHEPLDIDRFKRDLDNVAEGYQEVLHRMMGI